MTNSQNRGSSSQQTGVRQSNARETRENSSYSGSSSKGAQANLSQAAQEMRSGNPQERSEGASILGQAGGRQSHKNDPGRKGNQ